MENIYNICTRFKSRMEIMTQVEIIEGSKIIAEYLGWKYIPFNNLQGFDRAGWFEVHPMKEDIREFDTYTYSSSGELISTRKRKFDVFIFRYGVRHGWRKNDEYYYHFICRTHNDLRFYNDFNLLIDIINKIETENPGYVFHIRSYETKCEYKVSANTWRIFGSYEKDSMRENTFNTIVDVIKHLKNEDI